MTDGDDLSEGGGFDPKSRQLCPDDTCIGLIGPDGKCKVCGAESPDGPPPADDEPAAPDAPSASKPDDPEDDQGEASDGSSEEAPTRATSSESDGFDSDARILCSDGACTGLVGPDGRCKECGKPYEE